MCDTFNLYLKVSSLHSSSNVYFSAWHHIGPKWWRTQSQQLLNIDSDLTIVLITYIANKTLTLFCFTFFVNFTWRSPDDKQTEPRVHSLRQKRCFWCAFHLDGCRWNLRGPSAPFVTSRGMRADKKRSLDKKSEHVRLLFLLCTRPLLILNFGTVKSVFNATQGGGNEMALTSCC